MPKGYKLGGRVKGTPNKIPAEARARFKFLFDNYTTEEMQADLDALTPKERLFFIADIAEFIIPKLNRTEINASVNNKISLEIVRTITEVAHKYIAPAPAEGD